MWTIFKSNFKFIAHDPVLLMAIVAPFMLILFLRLIFPLLSDFILLKTAFQLYNYYPIAAVTMVSVIPMLFGMVYAFKVIDENDIHILRVISVTPAGTKNLLYMRMMVLSFLSFVTVLLTILLTNPVPSEGWLRTIYVSFLLAIQSPFTCLFIGGLAGNKVKGLALSILYGIFLVAVPLGLLLHHPWNYFCFFSPYYWISWAWVTSSLSESLFYGLISMIISIACILILLRHFQKERMN